MNQINYLSEHVGALYSELLERLMASSYSYRGLSFVKKKVKARQYWYLEVSIGADKKQYYFGPDDEQTRSTVESIKAKREHDSDAACSRKPVGWVEERNPTKVNVAECCWDYSRHPNLPRFIFWSIDLKNPMVDPSIYIRS